MAIVAEKIRMDASAARAAAEVGREAAEGFRIGRRARRVGVGGNVVEGMTERAWDGDVWAEGWLEGYYHDEEMDR